MMVEDEMPKTTSKAKRELVQTALRLPKALYAQLQIQAIRRGTTAQALATQAIEQFLKGGK